MYCMGHTIQRLCYSTPQACSAAGSNAPDDGTPDSTRDSAAVLPAGACMLPKLVVFLLPDSTRKKQPSTLAAGGRH